MVVIFLHIRPYDALWRTAPGSDIPPSDPNRNISLKRMSCKHIHVVLSKIADGEFTSEMANAVIKQQKAGKYERPSNIPPQFRKD